MVEKKSVASLANTSFIVVLPVGASRHGEEQSDGAIQSSPGYGAAGLLRCARNDVLYGAPADAGGYASFARRYCGYHLVKYTAVLRAAKAIAIPDHSGRPRT